MSEQIIRGLTLWRPWDVAMRDLGKPIENRDWPPPESVQGQLIALHSGKTWDDDGASDPLERHLLQRQALGLRGQRDTKERGDDPRAAGARRGRRERAAERGSELSEPLTIRITTALKAGLSRYRRAVEGHVEGGPMSCLTHAAMMCRAREVAAVVDNLVLLAEARQEREGSRVPYHHVHRHVQRVARRGHPVRRRVR